MERTASATALPCAVSTSTWRSLATISSGVCVLFLPIDDPPSASASHITGGPLLGGQVTAAYAQRENAEAAYQRRWTDPGFTAAAGPERSSGARQAESPFLK